jgi:uncharacterized membrane protein
MVNIYGISKFHVKIFTDAVFGVAITLLAVELQVPDIDSIDSSLIDSREFEELATTFVSYITTFFIIGIYWITYHSIFNPVRHTTDLMIWLNLSFLLLIAIIPFSVRLIDKYDNQNSFIFYSLIQILTGLVLFFMWLHAIKKQLLDVKSNDGSKTISSVIIRLTYIRTIIIPIVFVISIILSFSYPDIASIFPLILIPISFMVRLRYKHYGKLYAEEV